MPAADNSNSSSPETQAMPAVPAPAQDIPSEDTLNPAQSAPSPEIIDISELSEAEVAEIEGTASYAVVRRAPRFKAFFAVGAVIGVVLGIFVGIYLSEPGMINRGIYVVVCVLFTTMMTTLLTGLIASIIDRRSVARIEAQK